MVGFCLERCPGPYWPWASISMPNPNLHLCRYKLCRCQTQLSPSPSKKPQYSGTSPTNVRFFALPTLLPAPLAPASHFLCYWSCSAHTCRPIMFLYPSLLSPLLHTPCCSPQHGVLRSNLTPGQVACCRGCCGCLPWYHSSTTIKSSV